MNNTISHTICIDVSELQDISDIENKLKAMVTKAYKQMLIEILSKKVEEIFKSREYTKKGKVSRYICSQFGQVTYHRYKI